MWIKFHPYALELFSHVSPTGAPTAFCCQKNYVTGLSQPRSTQRENKTLFVFFSFFFFLFLLGTVVVNKL